MGNGLFQANAEVALLRGYYNLVLAREPPDGPIENGAFALHQLLKLRERKLAVGIESVPDGAAIWPVSSSMVSPILIMVSQLSPVLR